MSIALEKRIGSLDVYRYLEKLQNLAAVCCFICLTIGVYFVPYAGCPAPKTPE